jgi:hypothetical protein
MLVSVRAETRWPWLGEALRGGGLWFATVLDKLAMAAFTFRVAHVTEAQGLGVMSTVLAAAWVVGIIGGLGLVDAAVFRAAESRGRNQSKHIPSALGQWHGRFLFLVATACLSLGLAAGWVGGDDRFIGFARWMVAGSALRTCASLALGATRGWSEARWESWAAVGSATAVTVTAWMGATTTALGMGWCAAGALQLTVAAAACVHHPSLRPRWDKGPALPALIPIGAPYLALGLGSWLLGNIDIVAMRAADTPEKVGLLVAATGATRAAALAPWLCATLSLHRQHEWWQKGRATPIGMIILLSAGLAVTIGGTAWLARSWLALAFNVELSLLQGPLLLSLCTAPLWYAAQFLIPVGVALRPRGLLFRLFGALSLGGLASFLLATTHGPQGAIAGLAIGHGLVALLLSLWLKSVPRGTVQSTFIRSP